LDLRFYENGKNKQFQQKGATAMKNLIQKINKWYIEEPVVNPEYYNRIKTWPNLITAVGAVAGAGNIWLVSFTTWGAYSKISLLLLLIAGFSDLGDGFCARKTGQRSKFGEWFDPARDVVYIIAEINQLTVLLGWYVLIHPGLVLVYRIEALIICGGMLVGYYFRIKPHRAGKFRRAFHAVALFSVISMVIFGFSSANALPYIFFLMAAASLFALIIYARNNWQQLQLLFSGGSPCRLLRFMSNLSIF
jgi:phosphatidylglycerophosphate synthase